MHDGTVVVRFQREGTDAHLSVIEFDVAVTASESAGSTRGGNLGASISVLSAKLGEETSKGSSSETVSRLKFSIPVVLPSTPPLK